jgi:hypothetical protein
LSFSSSGKQLLEANNGFYQIIQTAAERQSSLIGSHHAVDRKEKEKRSQPTIKRIGNRLGDEEISKLYL